MDQTLPPTALVASLAKAYQAGNITVRQVGLREKPPIKFWNLDSFIFDGDEVSETLSRLERPVYVQDKPRDCIFIAKIDAVANVFVLAVQNDVLTVFPYGYHDGLWFQNVVTDKVIQLIWTMYYILAQPRERIIKTKAELHERARKWNEKTRKEKPIPASTIVTISKSPIVVIDKNIPIVVQPPVETGASAENGSKGAGSPKSPHSFCESWHHRPRDPKGCVCGDDTAPVWRMGWPIHAGVLKWEDDRHWHCERCKRLRWYAKGGYKKGNGNGEPRTFVVIAKKTPTQKQPDAVH